MKTTLACACIILGFFSGSHAAFAQDGPNEGCEGECGNTKHSTDGWCGNCADHCSGGTEAECTSECDQRCHAAERARDERCEQTKRDNNWQAKCDAANNYSTCDAGCRKANADGNRPAQGHFCSHDGGCRSGKRAEQGHWCSDGGEGKKSALAATGHWCSDNGDGRKGLVAAVSHFCADDGEGRKGCLATCGGQRSCRELWCSGAATKRQQCYRDADLADTACRKKCSGKHSTKCRDERCVMPFMIATCGKKKKITGFCAQKTVPLP